MHSIFRSVTAFLLAVLIVAPSVYMSAPAQPKQVQAMTIAGVTVDLNTAVSSFGTGAVSVLSCNLGGWIAGWVGGIFPWLSPEVTATTEVPAAIGLTGAGVAAPAGVAGLAGTGAVDVTKVPVTAPYLQAQNALISEQLAAIAANSLVSAQNTTNSAVQAGNMTFKECVLDPLMWMLKELVIDAVTKSIIDWIEGGFENTPQFLEDPSTFFENVLNDTVSAYLFESGLDQLICEPFAVDVVLDLGWSYYTPDKDPDFGRLSCDLDDAFPGVDISIDVNNDGVIDGADAPVPGADANTGYSRIVEQGDIDFAGGGFTAVMGIFDDQNNEIGTKFNVADDAADFAAQQASEQAMLLEQGDGMFPQRCDYDEDPSTELSVCSPGDFISHHVNQWTDGQLEQLQLADEFAEIINAAAQVLIQKLIGEAEGLLQGIN